MLQKLILLCLTLALATPVYPASAAEGTSARATASSKKKPSASTRSPIKNAAKSAILLDDEELGVLKLASSKALIIDQETGETLYAKGTDLPTPVASVTKLMTAMVVLDARMPMDEKIKITTADLDTLKGTGSRLRLGTELTRGELLQLALMASENRAASALGRAYPGGLTAFVNAMNAKAIMLGMTHSRFVEPTGLNSENVSTAKDLAKMVDAAYQYPEIREITTTPSHEVAAGSRRPIHYVNTNSLVRKGDWVIGLSKTGFINEAGRCLVMQAEIAGHPLIIILLDSWGKYSRIGDAKRIRKWIESSNVLSHMG